MNRALKAVLAVAIPVALFAVVAYAANVSMVINPQWFRDGLYVGPASMNPSGSANHKLTAMLGSGTVTIDTGLVDGGLCDENSSATVTGAAVGAGCVLGTAAAPPAGFQPSCYVSATNTVKLKMCNVADEAFNPASTTYTFRVFQ